MRDLAASLLDQEGPEPANLMEAMADSLVLFLDTRDDTDPTYLEWLSEHDIQLPSRQMVPVFFRTSPGVEPRPPSDREVTALTAAVEALNAFFTKHRATLSGPLLPADNLTHTARVATARGKTAITVTYPPTGTSWLDWVDEEQDEALPDISAAAATTLYRLQVKLAWQKSIWRRIELRGDQTLHDLHLAIQRAFDWDNDHLYAFFLSGKAWDQSTEYASPFGNGPRPANHARLDILPLTVGKQFLYIFDFGDELRHLVKLEAVTPDGVQPGVQYPRIVESHGASVPQYEDVEDE